MEEIFRNFDHAWMPITGLLIFFICFVIYTYWTFKKENKKFYENSSYMPLHDGVKHER
ncbi:MAG: CcoQ/FixQ family Cbb3-type cytochrome c oxidase assembly chaperone [Bacteriovorax sp.]|nr:CcoQ/FixQ family Cbb3-type cytochrome c oxidase assembly chaperone [Bacteriovorax sp.]